MVGRAAGPLVVGRDPVDLFVLAAPPRRRPLLFRVARHVMPQRWAAGDDVSLVAGKRRRNASTAEAVGTLRRVNYKSRS